MQDALGTIGISVLLSAVTTILASAMLFGATFLIFARFGAIVAANTGMSLAFAVVSFAALLALWGSCKGRVQGQHDEEMQPASHEMGAVA